MLLLHLHSIVTQCNTQHLLAIKHCNKSWRERCRKCPALLQTLQYCTLDHFFRVLRFHQVSFIFKQTNYNYPFHFYYNYYYYYYASSSLLPWCCNSVRRSWLPGPQVHEKDKNCTEEWAKVFAAALGTALQLF